MRWRRCSSAANHVSERPAGNQPTEYLVQDIDPTLGLPSVNVSNVLSEEKKQQVIGLGWLGCMLRRIQQGTNLRTGRASKTCPRGDHRLWRGGARGKVVPPEPQRGSVGERARAVPQTDRAEARAWTQCRSYLAGSGPTARASPPALRSRVCRSFSGHISQIATKFDDRFQKRYRGGRSACSLA